jgi:hypothetical protein
MPPPASRALVAARCIVTFRCSTVCGVSQWQRLGTALARKHKAVAWFLLAAQSCRPPCLQIGALRQRQGGRHHCLSVRDGLWPQSVGKARDAMPKAFGFDSLAHRGWHPVATARSCAPASRCRLVAEPHHRFRQFGGLHRQLVGKADYRHAQAPPGCRVVLTSSVTMRPRESLRLVMGAHRHYWGVRQSVWQSCGNGVPP